MAGLRRLAGRITTERDAATTFLLVLFAAAVIMAIGCGVVWLVRKCMAIYRRGPHSMATRAKPHYDSRSSIDNFKRMHRP